MVGPFRQSSQRRQAAHGEFCSPAAKLPSVAEHSDEGYEDATTDMPRLPCLPSAATVQSRADAALAERSVCFTQGFVVVFAVILSASLFVSSSRALEQIGNVAFPLCVLLISAAVWPGAPSEMGKAYLLRLAALGALGGGRVAYARYVESGDRSIFEGTVKVVVAVQFSVALACVVIVCSCLHARHTWTVHRVALIFANSVRAAAVLLLRYGSPEPAIVYPPDLPFGCALFTSVLWIILLVARAMTRSAKTAPRRRFRAHPSPRRRARPSEDSNRPRLPRDWRRRVARQSCVTVEGDSRRRLCAHARCVAQTAARARPATITVRCRSSSSPSSSSDRHETCARQTDSRARSWMA